MDPWLVIWIAMLFAAVAVLYSSVGHGGASGYLAIMALLGMAPEQMRPTALMLNIVVAGIATIRFRQAGYLNWSLLWPFVVVSVPMAFLGGVMSLGDQTFRLLVGSALLLAAVQVVRQARSRGTDEPARPPMLPLALGSGAGIGLISGLTGVGGGIFLSPLMLLCGWATVRDVAGVAAAFVLCNSIAGLAGRYAAVASVPGEIWIWGPVVAMAAVAGSVLGSRVFGGIVLRICLAGVLLIAAVKLMGA